MEGLVAAVEDYIECLESILENKQHELLDWDKVGVEDTLEGLRKLVHSYKERAAI